MFNIQNRNIIRNHSSIQKKVIIVIIEKNGRQTRYFFVYVKRCQMGIRMRDNGVLAREKSSIILGNAKFFGWENR